MRLHPRPPTALGTLCALYALCVPSLSADVLEYGFDVSPGGTLTVRTIQGRIDIQTIDEDRVEVEVVRKVGKGQKDESQKVLDSFAIEVAADGPDVSISGELAGPTGPAWQLGNPLSIRFRIRVPRVYDLDLETAAGDVSINAPSGAIRATVTEGSLTLIGIDGSAEVSVSGGALKALFDTSPQADCRLHTSGGELIVGLPPTIAAVLDARANGGKIKRDLPLPADSEFSKTKHRATLRATLNGGGPLVTLRSSGGTIRLRERKGPASDEAGVEPDS